LSKPASARGTTATTQFETDRRLHRLLLILSDGVFAIALTLLAVQLALPEGSGDVMRRWVKEWANEGVSIDPEKLSGPRRFGDLPREGGW
jgi:hypothetical protein